MRHLKSKHTLAEFAAQVDLPNNTQQQAFTLAEVLITLGIIGLVAALTMSPLIANHKEKEYSVKLKKIYTTLSQAYTQAVNDHGTPDNWNILGPNDPTGAQNFIDTISPYLKVAKNCGNQGGCWYDKTITQLNGSNWANYNNDRSYSTLQLGDGTLMAFLMRSADCTFARGESPDLATSCALAIVDTNGSTPPNQFGRDVFWFMITKYNVIPFGTQGDTFQPFQNCNKNSSGFGCAAWVIFNENMDYLHCDDLNWENKTKCN